VKALVLSAGGGFGAYQAGVWRGLEELGWSPDLVVGASIGAVNGYAIARGASAEELASYWLDLPGELDPRFRRESADSIFDLRRFFTPWIERAVSECARRPAQRELRVALTQVPFFRYRIVADPGVTARHIVASCALPGILPPVRVDGSYFIDGGTLCLLPLREALRAGAAEVVAVDLLHGGSCAATRKGLAWVRGAGRLFHRERLEPTPEELARARILHIGRPGGLGSFRHCFRWDREQTERLLAAGYEDSLRLMGAEAAEDARQTTTPQTATSNAPSSESAAPQ